MPRHHGSKAYTSITRDEAEDVMEKARANDYWRVDAYYDNKDDLQAAIDCLYNSVQGNQYEVTLSGKRKRPTPEHLLPAL